MKNFRNTFFSILIVVGLASCLHQEPQKIEKPIPPPLKAVSEQMACVNMDSLLNHYLYFKKIKTAMENKSKKAQLSLTNKGMAFEKAVAEYQKKISTMTAEQRASTEQALARKQQEISLFNQRTSAALANEQSAEDEKLYNKISSFLKSYAKDKGYRIIFAYSKANPTVLYANDSLDVTQEVVEQLNKAYKAGASK